MKPLQKRLKSDAIPTQFSWNRILSDTDMARVQRSAKRCRIALENYVTDVVTEMEVTTEADTIEEPAVKTITISSQTYQSGVTKDERDWE